mmetsp:Transcript_6795/g.11434  ORF Transcript_6795/g.11434 Transcript_6795/m.11434 type:complete len:114 (+) Transcript_6795:895-1236(+)
MSYNIEFAQDDPDSEAQPAPQNDQLVPFVSRAPVIRVYDGQSILELPRQEDESVMRKVESYKLKIPHIFQYYLQTKVNFEINEFKKEQAKIQKLRDRKAKEKEAKLREWLLKQ